MIVLCRCNYIGVCRGSVCVNDLVCRSYIGVCKIGVYGSDFCQAGLFYKGIVLQECQVRVFF